MITMDIVLNGLALAEWDFGSLLDNSKDKATIWGGSILALAGIIGLVAGGFFGIRKLIASPQSQNQQRSWGVIVGLVVLGGSLLFGGLDLLLNISHGANTTISELGGGTILPAMLALVGG